MTTAAPDGGPMSDRDRAPEAGPVGAGGAARAGTRAVAHAVAEATARVGGPILLALLLGGALLAVLGRDPFAYYGDILRRGLVASCGVQDAAIRMAPLLLMASGLIIAFRANIWNIGGDGQFLLAAALVAGVAPWLVGAVPNVLAFVVLGILGAAVGAAWTLVPAYLKAAFGVNEIITSLMLTFVGVNLGNLLIKGPFRSTTTIVPQTDVIPFRELLPRIPGTRVHVGLLVAVAAIVAVHYLMTRTSFGLKLRVLGASPRAAAHAGLSITRLTMVGFALSGAFMGLAAAVEILGVWGYMRADWNPGFGLPLFALVFLARLDAVGVIPLVGFYGVISMGGHYAARRADLPDDFMLVIVGLALLFMALAEFLASRRDARVRQSGSLSVSVKEGAPDG
ncbi:MAG: putative B6 ABC transporter permease subunit 2 [Thermoleophilia bacterium]